MAIKKSGLGDHDSFSAKFLANRDSTPQVSAIMAKGVSEQRRVILSDEVNQGYFRDGSGPNYNQMSADNGETANGRVISSVGMNKYGQAASGSGSIFRGVHGDSVKQMPEVYSPLWLNSNLNLPRDRATINAWCRSFFALNPIVHNAISLHSTFPISKLSIKCPNKDIEKFFDDMIEEIDLMNICVQIAQEYWLLGEAFVYAELDEGKGKWGRLHIQNPDFMIVKRTVVANEPIIMLRPDENLKKIIFSNRPTDMEQRKQLNQHIIESVRRGENIPLDNFHVSHLARRISPYEIRGTGLPVCIFRHLMLFDKLFESKFAQADNMINPTTIVKIGSESYKPTSADLEAWRDVFACYDEETEVLTDQGFKKYSEIIDYNENDKAGNAYNSKPKSGIKIACFNPKNEQLEYHSPLGSSLYNYNGDMYHFANEKMDIKVTPNHKMWLSEKQYEYHGHRSLRKTVWSEWKKVEAKDIKLTDYKRFRSQIKWIGDDSPKTVDVCGNKVSIELYLEYLGYVLSEGNLYSNGKSQHTIRIFQSTPKYYKEMKQCMDNMSIAIGKSYAQSITKADDIDRKSDLWTAGFCGKELYEFIKSEIGDADGQTKAPNKCVPLWIKQLSPRLLQICLDALVMGDGSIYDNPKKESNRFAYYSTSKQLADDVYEMAYKCGYVPTEFVRDDEKYTNRPDHEILPLYTVLWSTTNKGNFPLVYKTSRDSRTRVKHNILNIEKYNGKVWCFEVPTGLFITRRNGKITIQANSAQFDKDFKIFTHEGVAIERVGWGQGIYDISGDLNLLIKLIYVGLQVPSVLMDGGQDTTYANGGVALDVLRQRYMQFRNMMSTWLRTKIFAPISKIQGFYDYSGGEKQLIVPEVDWNHMSLFDAGDYINNLVTLTQGGAGQKRVSLHTLYRSMGLEFEDEIRRMRKESIQDAVTKKEAEALDKMKLNALRALDDDENEIPEPQAIPGQTEQPVPGETGGGIGGGLPDLGLPGSTPPPMGGLPLPPPPPPPMAIPPPPPPK